MGIVKYHLYSVSRGARRHSHYFLLSSFLLDSWSFVFLFLGSRSNSFFGPLPDRFLKMDFPNSPWTRNRHSVIETLHPSNLSRFEWMNAWPVWNIVVLSEKSITWIYHCFRMFFLVMHLDHGSDIMWKKVDFFYFLYLIYWSFLLWRLNVNKNSTWDNGICSLLIISNLHKDSHP